MAKTLVCALFALALSAAATLAQAEILIAIDHANPPFMYQQDGQPKGLYPVLVQGVFKHAGIAVSIQALPWKRALKKAENAEVGIAGIYKTAPRLVIFDYSQPIFEEKLIVYVRRDQAFQFTQVSDLYGKRIGVIRGWSYTEALDEAIKSGRIEASENSSDEANFKKLASGRLDAVIAIELAGQRIIQQLRLTNMLALQPALSINPTYLVFAKQARQQALLQRFDQSLQAMSADGSLAELVQQAIGNQ
ncbi:ABC transporter substrate-binding protein [Pseudomonas sp.]|uniref:substrate-binding periplasmic protein n=1 Tax=Pseudomonas sp. TaxID=306 RepID=UPI0027329FDD|nr:transporter substrate-binding domain-containing protein [Pseudomonas sp.]MDP3815731.1 transporter substrate-binding domain-containing protein [Pseudomonas sp.]